jgi:hypothetical protein
MVRERTMDGFRANGARGAHREPLTECDRDPLRARSRSARCRRDARVRFSRRGAFETAIDREFVTRRRFVRGDRPTRAREPSWRLESLRIGLGSPRTIAAGSHRHARTLRSVCRFVRDRRSRRETIARRPAARVARTVVSRRRIREHRDGRRARPGRGRRRAIGRRFTSRGDRDRAYSSSSGRIRR